MRLRFLVPLTILATLALAAPSLAAEVNPTSQIQQFNVAPSRVDVTGMPANTFILFRLTRANGVVASEWKSSGPDGAVRYGWWGKAIGTDTLSACPDAARDGTCDSPAVQSTMTWTQFPAIRSYKNGAPGVITGLFDEGKTVAFNMNVACVPGGAFYQWQAFFLMKWTDAGGTHRFTSDYMSTNTCVQRGDGGHDLTTFGWGRDERGEAFPYKIIISVPVGAPAVVRFGVGNTADGDFLNGRIKGGLSSLQYISG